MKKKPAAGAGKAQAAAPATSSLAAGQKRRLEVLRQFRVLLRSIKRHYQWVEEQCGVSGAQLWAMSEIAATPGIKVGELAQQLGVHLSTASNMLRRLEELALIRRTRAARDQRVVRLQLTDKGAGILELAPRPLVGLLQQALADLPQERVDSLHAVLGEIVQLMQFKDTEAHTTPLSDL